MSFLDAREHGSKVGSGGHASAQNEVRAQRPWARGTSAWCSAATLRSAG